MNLILKYPIMKRGMMKLRTPVKATLPAPYVAIDGSSLAVMTYLKGGRKKKSLVSKRAYRKALKAQGDAELLGHYSEGLTGRGPSTGDARRLRVNPPRQWFDRPNVILSKLLSNKASIRDLHAAVLFASVTPFQADQKESLLQGLESFIASNRFSNKESVLTVLGAAVRKYCLNMRPDQFDSISHWLAPSQTEAVSPIFELELSKGVHWRLKSLPIRSGVNAPVLLDALESAAESHLHANRLVNPQTVAVAASLCVAALELRALMKTDDGLVDFIDRMKQPQNPRLLRIVSRQLISDAMDVRSGAPDFANRLMCLAAFDA